MNQSHTSNLLQRLTQDTEKLKNSNMPKNDRKDVEEILSNKNIIIKEAEKETAVVILNK